MDLLQGSREEGVSMEHVFPMIDLPETGKRIKELREQRGISVKQLQRFLGFEQPQAIYKWQRGECLPTFDNMYAIACFFNVKIDDILVGNRQDFFCPKKMKKKQNSCAVFLLNYEQNRRIINAGENKVKERGFIFKKTQ